jgi:hypothetical protein
MWSLPEAATTAIRDERFGRAESPDVRIVARAREKVLTMLLRRARCACAGRF